MPDTKISALTAASSAADASELAINEAGTSKKVTVGQVLATTDRVVARYIASGISRFDDIVLLADAPEGTYRICAIISWPTNTDANGTTIGIKCIGDEGEVTKRMLFRASSMDNGSALNMSLDTGLPFIQNDDAEIVFRHFGSGGISLTNIAIGDASAPTSTYDLSVVLESIPDSPLPGQYYGLAVNASGGTVSFSPGTALTGNGGPGFSQHYEAGTSVALTASNVVTWSGDVPGGHETDNPLTIVMDGAKMLVATIGGD